jgi:hypothetical protein
MGRWEVGWVSEENSVVGAVFVVLVCAWYISVVVEEGVCVRGCRGLGLCKVGIVGWSVGDECDRGRDTLVTDWGRMGVEREGWGRRVGEKG